jgi:hypothetical protein
VAQPDPATAFFGRVLAITEDVIVRSKTMAVEGRKRRHTFGQPDLFIAAIAALKDLVVVTRDTGEFVIAGVPVFDPWSNILYVHGKEMRIEPPASVHGGFQGRLQAVWLANRPRAMADRMGTYRNRQAAQ